MRCFDRLVAFLGKLRDGGRMPDGAAAGACKTRRSAGAGHHASTTSSLT